MQLLQLKLLVMSGTSLGRTSKRRNLSTLSRERKIFIRKDRSTYTLVRWKKLLQYTIKLLHISGYLHPLMKLDPYTNGPNWKILGFRGHFCGHTDHEVLTRILTRYACAGMDVFNASGIQLSEEGD